MKTCLLAMVAAVLAAGCSSVLGFKDPKLDDSTGNQTPDAAIDAPTDTGPAACVPAACPFGCDTTANACRDGKLWVFATIGGFLGNGFGGMDTPPSVRATSDALCFATFSTKHMMRQCSQTRTHAVLSVGTADSLALMATKYAIPTTVPVHRADDAVLVVDNWNDLLDMTKQPRAPITTAATETAGIVWTGVGESATCKNWTSEAASESGVQGHTTLTSSNWMARGATECDLFAHLLCVCWPGAE